MPRAITEECFEEYLLDGIWHDMVECRSWLASGRNVIRKHDACYIKAFRSARPGAFLKKTPLRQVSNGAWITIESPAPFIGTRTLYVPSSCRMICRFAQSQCGSSALVSLGVKLLHVVGDGWQFQRVVCAGAGAGAGAGDGAGSTTGAGGVTEGAGVVMGVCAGVGGVGTGAGALTGADGPSVTSMFSTMTEIAKAAAETRRKV